MAEPDDDDMERMYEQELEMMREMRAMEEAQQMAANLYEDAAPTPPASAQQKQPATPASVAASVPASPAQRAPPSAAQGGRSFFLDSPALSQISTLSDGNLSTIGGGGAVNRRLFGTPFHGAGSRFASTPLHGTAGPSTAAAAVAQRPATIVEQDADEDGAMRCNAAAVECPATRKRRLEDLFGDIGDIADDNDDGPDANRDRLYNAMAKRARTEAEIDLDMIEAILERRKQRLLAAAAAGGGLAGAGRCGGVTLQAERLEALHRFKRQNLSYVRPQWPYTTLRRCGAANSVLDRERVYVRMHSEQFEHERIEEVVGRGADARRADGVLGAARADTWAMAQKIMNDRLTAQANRQPATTNVSTPMLVDASSGGLWVEKYRPKKYVDLLSDETTNRSLLSWLKMWDKVVFNRDYDPDIAAKHAALNAKKATFSASGSSFGGSATLTANAFNKKSGKFEPFQRFGGGGGGAGAHSANSTKPAFTAPFVPFGQGLHTSERDQLGRPQQKVVLLCGPPGLGKTTLAHTIARHAGYAVRELNASDDRSPEAFRQALENGTQMQPLLTSVGTADSRRPNCIVLDEIDGAPAPAIEFLCRFLSDGGTAASAAAKTDAKGAAAPAVVGKKRKAASVLRRPIICICNDAYAPALRPLRQLAFIVNFGTIGVNRLAERLAQIARAERMRADMAALLALAEKTGSDVRACLAVLQFHHDSEQVKGGDGGGDGGKMVQPPRPLTLLDVLRTNVGQKDRQRGLFAVWQSVFQIRRPQKTLVDDEMPDGEEGGGGGADRDVCQMVAMTDMSSRTRWQNVLDAVHMGGDYERLMGGVHENYLAQKMPDPNMRGVAEACDWFCFADRLRQHIGATKNYSVYGYQQFGFVAWHFLFGNLVYPKLSYPKRGAEFARKAQRHRQIETAMRGSMAAGRSRGIGDGAAVLLDTLPLVRHVLCPQLRSVSLQLLSPRERADLRHTVEVMVDLGLIYVQAKSPDGTYQYHMEPNINMLSTFADIGGTGPQLSYSGRQLIAREVELEKMRRVVPKATAAKPNTAPATPKAGVVRRPQSPKPLSSVPNHLQSLQPKRGAGGQRLKETVTKDFFGRMSSKQTAITVQEGGTDVIVKSPIWYRYKEGCNNAVRKDLTISNLL